MRKIIGTGHWIDKGFHGLEEKLRQRAGIYSVGDTLSLVDVCLVPQVYNAERFDLDMSRYPHTKTGG